MHSEIDLEGANIDPSRRGHRRGEYYLFAAVYERI